MLKLRGTALLLALTLATSAGCDSGAAPHAGSSPKTAQPTGPAPPVPSPQAGPGSPRTARPAAAGNPSGLSDAQMVGQLFMTYVYGAGATRATPAQRAANLALYGVPTGAEVVRRWHLGGIILTGYNNLDPDRPTLATDNVDAAPQITALTRGLQHAAHQDSGTPLLIATDQEGGRVQRITDGVTARASQQSLASTGRHALTCGYLHLGQQLRALGVNQDLAPVADVVTTSTGVIGDRSFGPDPRLDAADVTAAVAGLQAAGVLATLKHWPGHGSTSTDSHARLAVIHESLRTWQSVDRVPFAAAGPTADAVMVGHLAFPAVDPSGTAATFSRVLTRQLLRGRLGYRGLLLTDSLWMAPARDAGTPGRVALRILAAGNDVLLESPALPTAYTAVLHAVARQPSVRARVRDAVRHILAAKERIGRPAPTHSHC